MNNNVSNEEIDKFNKHDWWDTNGPLKTLHDINPARFDFILNHTSLSNKLVLDVGCGGGIVAEGLAARGAKVCAIDMAAEAINSAKEHAKSAHLDIDYQQITTEGYAETHKKHFDIITCLEMLEHVPNPSAILAACAEMLKPDGAIFLSTINRTLKARALAIFAAESVLKIVPQHTHHYEHFITPLELYEMCESAGFTIKRIRGMNYNPFTRIAYLQEDVSINYLLYAIKK